MYQVDNRSTVIDRRRQVWNKAWRHDRASFMWKESVAEAQGQEILEQGAREIFRDWTGNSLEGHAKEFELHAGNQGKAI